MGGPLAWGGGGMEQNLEGGPKPSARRGLHTKTLRFVTPKHTAKLECTQCNFAERDCVHYPGTGYVGPWNGPNAHTACAPRFVLPPECRFGVPNSLSCSHHASNRLQTSPSHISKFSIPPQIWFYTTPSPLAQGPGKTGKRRSHRVLLLGQGGACARGGGGGTD